MLFAGYQCTSRTSEEIQHHISRLARIGESVSDEFYWLLSGVYIILHGIAFHSPDGGLAFFFSLSGVFELS